MNGMDLDRSFSDGAGFRGQPLLAVAVVLAGWTAFRMLTWSVPDSFQPHFDRSMPTIRSAIPANTVAAPVTGDGSGSAQEAGGNPLYWPVVRQPLLPAPDATLSPARQLPTWHDRALKRPLPGASPAQANAAMQASGAQAIVGHNLMLAAGLSRLQVPAAFARLMQRAPLQSPAALPASPPVPVLAAGPAPSAGRWTADGWLFLRGGSGGQLAAGQPSYGRSQAGAVARYELAPGSRHRPQAYVRASSALQGAREHEAAAGLSARPLPAVPVRAGAELRVRDGAYGSEVRPAVLAVTEFAPLRMGQSARAESYVQAGYVGGDFATPFVDGQARVTVDVAEFDRPRLSVGGGVWGGAQKGAARLDVGPSAALTFRLGQANSRLAVDYRWRVAGDAEPKSGPALTLSAGF